MHVENDALGTSKDVAVSGQVHSGDTDVDVAAHADAAHGYRSADGKEGGAGVDNLTGTLTGTQLGTANLGGRESLRGFRNR